MRLAWGNLLRKCALRLLIVLPALAAPIAARADSPPQPIPVDGKCAVPVDPDWTKQEQFVWLNVCVGKEADFNKEPGYGGDLDPKSPMGLPENRILRSSFLETILLKDMYRSALTRLGVRITGARFTETVDLRNAELRHDLWLDRSLLEKGVDLRTAETTRRITLEGSKIIGTFNAIGSQINKDLSMSRAEISDAVNLSSAHIGRRLDLDDSTVTGKIEMIGAYIGGPINLNGSAVTGMLDMDAMRVDQSLFMRDKAQFTEINLVAAHIGGTLDLNGSTVTGMLNMNGIRVDQGLFMRENASFAEINLTTAHIGGQLDLNGSTVAGELVGEYIDVEKTMFLGLGAAFADKIDLTSSILRQDLNLSGGTFNKAVALTGTRVAGVLRLDSTQWLGSATLNLDDAAVGGIDLSHNWPANVDLNGLTYRNLSNISKNTSQQAKIWFGTQPYAPQPYQQLASVLQANGWITDATTIRYAGKERERKATPWGLYWFWLVLLDWSIGFGYYLQYAFYWAVGFVLLGWAVLYATGQRTKHGTTLGLTYSFDMLLPLVQLRKKNYDIDLDPWPQRYFYVHKIVGVILTSFIVAGISGLTK